MVRQVEVRKLYIAIADIKDGKISFAKLNNFVVKLDKDGNVRMYDENKATDKSVPLEHDFACFIETFEKSDLQPGMIVQTREHDTLLVLPDRLISAYQHCSLDEYNDDLTYKSVNNELLDIIKVFKIVESANIEEYLELKGVEEIASINRIVEK